MDAWELPLWSQILAFHSHLRIPVVCQADLLSQLKMAGCPDLCMAFVSSEWFGYLEIIQAALREGLPSSCTIAGLCVRDVIGKFQPGFLFDCN